MKKLLLTILLVGLCRVGYCTDYTAYSSCKLALLLDETSGSYTDSSSTNATINRTGGTMGVGGQFDSAWQGAFPENINTTDSTLDNFSAFTMLGWVKDPGNPVGQSQTFYFGKVAPYDEIGKWIHNDSGYISAFVSASTSRARSISTEGISSSVYDFITITYDDAGDRKIIIYKNGTETGYLYSIQEAASGTITDESSYDYRLNSGAGHWGQSYFDENSYFNAVLSSTEINDIMDNGLVGSAGGGTIQNIRNSISNGICQGLNSGMR